MERHSPDQFTSHAKGELFPVGTTIDQIADGIKEVFAKGARQSEHNTVVQTFAKRIRLNGETANYKLFVDMRNKYVITFIKIGQ